MVWYGNTKIDVVEQRSPRVQTPRVTPVRPPSAPTTPGLSEQDQKVLEQTRTALREIQEEFSFYRKEKGENERSV